MNQSDSSLDRLLRSAGQHQPATAGVASEEAPFGFTTRVVAGWLDAAAHSRPGLEVLWFRRSFLCALALMAISVGWSYQSGITTSQSDETTIASYDATADLP